MLGKSTTNPSYKVLTASPSCTPIEITPRETHHITQQRTYCTDYTSKTKTTITTSTDYSEITIHNQLQSLLPQRFMVSEASRKSNIDRVLVWWRRKRQFRRKRSGGEAIAPTAKATATVVVCADREQSFKSKIRRSTESLIKHTQRSAKTSALLELPNELLLEIFRNLPRMQDCNALRQTNHSLHNLFAWDFNKRAISDHGASLGRWAVHHRDQEFLTPWLDRGLDVDTRNDYGETILLVAVKCCNEGVAQLLLERGADVNATDTSLSSVLYWAIMTGKSSNVRMVLAGGGDANGSARGRWTLLHSAVLIRDDEIVRLLLTHGARPYTVSLGITPLEFAEQKNWSGLAKCIDEYPVCVGRGLRSMKLRARRKEYNCNI